MNFIHPRKLNRSGVTLVEMLVVMGLLGGLLVVMATIFTSAADVQQSSSSYSSTLASGRFIMARLNYDIANASAVVIPSSLGASGSTLEITVGGSNETFSTSGSDLQLTDSSGSAAINSADVKVSAVNFQVLGNSGGAPTVQYSFTITSNVTPVSGAATETFNGAAGLNL